MKVAIQSCKNISGRIDVGGDKSITHRSLIIASLANGTSKIEHYSRCDDCWSTLRAMRSLGVVIKEKGNDLIVHGHGLHGLKEPDNILDCGNSGTTIRLLSGALAGQQFYTILNGDTSLRSRPMDRIITPLRSMGANIKGRSADRFPPLCIQGTRLRSIEYTLPVPSAQVKSAILLAGLQADRCTRIIEPKVSRDHTERLLTMFDADIECHDGTIAVRPGALHASDITVPGDISSAAYFIVLGCLVDQSDIIIKDVGVNPTRTGILDVLMRMGACCTISNERFISNEPIADLTVTTSVLKGITLSPDMVPRIIDELPLLAVTATQAEGTTIVQGAGELRVKETDRISAIVQELKKLGADIHEREDGFIINGPTPLYGARCCSHNDHRIAMSCSIAGLIAQDNTSIDEVSCVAISCPEFFDKIRDLTHEKVCILES